MPLWWLLTLSPSPAAEVDLKIVAEDFDLSAHTERSLRRILTRMFRTYQDTMGLSFSDPTPVHVRLVADRVEYERRASSMGLVGSTLGFFSTRLGEGVVWKNTSAAQMHATIVHEASHYLMSAGGAVRAPLWLHEGMAELFEGARLSGNAIYLDPAPGMVDWLHQRGPGLPPLEAFLDDPRAWSRLPSTPVGSASYGVGWSLCAFLMSSPSGKAALAQLLQHAGEPPSATLQAAWPGGVRQLDQDWRAWWGRPIASLQLPIPTVTGQQGVEVGWIRCANGNLIARDSGMECGRWVAGENGVMTFVPDR
ncbi:MAG TPA: hypothetical protein ENK18_14075 [Deltaproteobacteria bacterium]|nr:hypothetical protein [Deltaproteobacteria bacterium]